MEEKNSKMVTLYAAISDGQHDGLRTIAFSKKKSLAEVTREAIDYYLQAELPGALKTIGEIAASKTA
jgi:hypothetical protein